MIHCVLGLERKIQELMAKDKQISFQEKDIRAKVSIFPGSSFHGVHENLFVFVFVLLLSLLRSKR